MEKPRLVSFDHLRDEINQLANVGASMRKGLVLPELAKIRFEGFKVEIRKIIDELKDPEFGVAFDFLRSEVDSLNYMDPKLAEKVDILIKLICSVEKKNVVFIVPLSPELLREMSGISTVVGQITAK